MSVKQSVCVPMLFPGAALDRELFEKIKAMGYQAVEFWTRESLGDYRTVFQTVRDTGLEIATITGHNSLPEGMNNPDNHDRIGKELKESIAVAAEYGIPGLICFSGNRNGAQSDIEGMRECAAMMRRIAPVAEKAGINLNMELLNSRIDHPAYQCDHSDWGFAMCEMAGSDRVKLLFDIYHMQIMEGDIIRTIERGIKYIGHFHTAGVPGRRDMDQTQELNYRAVSQAVSGTGYPYFIGHEFKPKGDTMTALKETYRIFNV